MNIKKFLAKPQTGTYEMLKRKADEIFPNTFIEFRFVFISQLPLKVSSTRYAQCSKPIKFFRFIFTYYLIFKYEYKNSIGSL